MDNLITKCNKIAVFGGSFDPFTIAHGLVVAELLKNNFF